MRLLLCLLIGTLSLQSSAWASSVCYLYSGDDYWNCLREERHDEQEQEELRDQIAQDTEEALQRATGEAE